MVRRVLVLNGHPDPRPERLCAALCDAYVRGAHGAGYEVRRIDIGALDFPLIRSEAEFVDTTLGREIAEAQAALAWADHLVLVFPLWLGGVPALTKGFLEQVFRYGFALSPPGQPMRGLLTGRSARLIVTMGMPGTVFRVIFGAFGVRWMERGLLWICGIRPIRRTVFGSVQTAGDAARKAWLARVEALGATAA